MKLRCKSFKDLHPGSSPITIVEFEPKKRRHLASRTLQTVIAEPLCGVPKNIIPLVLTARECPSSLWSFWD